MQRSLVRHKEDGTDSTFHTELLLKGQKGDDSVERGYALEQDVVQNKFTLSPGTRSTASTRSRSSTAARTPLARQVTDFNMPNTP